MQQFQGLIGIVLILGIAWLASNNKKKINYRLVISGILLQVIIAVLILKVSFVKSFFQKLGNVITHIEGFAKEGASFVYGGIMTDNHTGGSVPYGAAGVFIFGFSVLATIILVCVLMAILYHWGIMQRVVAVIARAMNWIMRVSGAEALSNVASAFVGQIEAQVMIRPYLNGMTMSELLASMSGSLACIAGSILVVYVSFGARAEYLLAASLMAAPGALVISKIVWPETEESETMGKVKLEVKTPYANTIDAITHGAGDGMKISINIIAMLIGFLGLIALVNYLLLKIGVFFHFDFNLTLEWIFGKIFSPMAWCMGVPAQDVPNVATMLGKKITVNEFVAFTDLTQTMVHNSAGQLVKGYQNTISPKSLLIVSFAICGFANFSSVGMQIGGIGALAPERRADLAKLGMKALLCGTLASYLSATIAGLLMG
ncbi:MAG TPA: nucleoside transporter C-terminal domain-containing protein [Ferruginibacter sp.]|jgi:CNT family concentrative nucleoside transporter|nr:nucleoside transporter C-terminal domain-containing protein [Ferruginibacter sp.]